MAQGESLAKVTARGLVIVGTIFAVLGIPAWVFLGLGSPDDKFYLVGISLGFYSLLFLFVLFLLIYQGITQSDITKSKWWIRLFGK